MNPQTRLDLYHDARAAWIAEARRIALDIAAHDGDVDADRLAARFPLADGLAPQTVASVFTKGFQRVGVKISTRTNRRGGYVGVYVAMT